MAEARCVICGFEPESLAGVMACPQCGTKSVPCDPKNDIEVRINWHELAILVMWAERWADHIKEGSPDCPKVVYAIAQRLQAQFPERSSLTLSGQFQEIKAKFPGTKIYDDKGNEKELGGL